MERRFANSDSWHRSFVEANRLFRMVMYRRGHLAMTPFAATGIAIVALGVTGVVIWLRKRKPHDHVTQDVVTE